MSTKIEWTEELVNLDPRIAILQVHQVESQIEELKRKLKKDAVR